MTLDCLKLVSLPFSLLCLCFDICLQWSYFWYGEQIVLQMDLWRITYL